MKETLEVPNRMVADRVIAQYAIAGAVATCNYIEATVTDDLDILIAVEVLEEQPPITQYADIRSGATRELSSADGPYSFCPSPVN
jgi:hypothetical protein